PADRVWVAALLLWVDDDHDEDGDRSALAKELVRNFDGLGDEQAELASVVARALRAHGDPRAAEAVLARAPASAGTATARAAELERGHAALARGALDKARAHFAQTFATPLESAEARLGMLAVLVAVGELSGVDAELASVVALLQEGETPLALTRAVADLTSSLARLSGRAARRPLPSLDEARKDRARARDAGRALDALEAGALCVDSAIVGGDRASVAVEAEHLAVASERVGSRRFALQARFGALVSAAHSAPLSSTALVELAQVMHESPVVARRANALLGENVPLDDVDRAVLEALSAHAPAHASAVVRKAAGPEWTVDAGSMRIILVDGRTVDLAHKKVLFDLLAALCASGGAASKEQLLERAWGVRDYHPLRHDNRLKVAVRKLRRLLEEILGDDPIESAGEGYRLRGKVRFLR
ncbi:MAG TPA: winged helix-turn-helix domain-containing protein, partial [Myxococcota bacterium]